MGMLNPHRRQRTTLPLKLKLWRRHRPKKKTTKSASVRNGTSIGSETKRKISPRETAVEKLKRTPKKLKRILPHTLKQATPNQLQRKRRMEFAQRRKKVMKQKKEPKTTR